MLSTSGAIAPDYCYSHCYFSILLVVFFAHWFFSLSHTPAQIKTVGVVIQCDSGAAHQCDDEKKLKKKINGININCVSRSA